MPHWETIQDHSSHISQVRLIPTKNYSVERGNGIFDAISKTSIPITPTNISKPKVMKKSRNMFKLAIIKFIVLLLFITSAVSLFWQCSKPERNTNDICIRVNSSLNMQRAWIEDTKILIHQSYSRVTQPLFSKVNNAYHCIDTGDAIERLGNKIKPLMDIPRQVVQDYIRPYWKKSKEVIYMYIALWRQQLDDYIEHGSNRHKPNTSNSKNDDEEEEESDTVVEEKIKKTAKRILEYIDKLNLDTVKTGMKGDEAKEKAKEIIKSITEETKKTLTKQEVESWLVVDKDEEDTTTTITVESEIQSIMEIAAWERVQLQQKLELLQSRLTVDDTTEDPDLLIAALKLEIEHLRADAENKVRRRTKEAINHLDNIKSTTSESKDNILRAQRNALKDLRQVYRDIYQTNQAIDNLVIT